MSNPYEPVRVRCCPKCGGTGVVNARDPKTVGPYEPVGLKKCPLCHGAEVVTETDLRDAAGR